jgi:chromosome segregation ATPase
MAITIQDIHATADKIVAAGGTPTLAAVRKALGGGSFTTISEAMQEWKSKQHAQTAAPIREAAPASVSERLTAFGSEIWSIALEMANVRLQSEREALEQTRQEMEATQQEAVDLADQLTEELEQAQATIEQQAQEIKALNAQINELKAENKAANIKASESAQAASVLQGKIEVMEKQSELYNAYLVAVKKLDEIK